MGNQGSSGSSGDKKKVKSSSSREAEIKLARHAIAVAKQAAESRARSEAHAEGVPWLPPKAGEFVYSTFGPAVVKSFNPEGRMYHVVPAWRLAPGAAPESDEELKTAAPTEPVEGQVHAFLNSEAIFKMTLYKDKEGKKSMKRVDAETLFNNIYPGGQRVTSPFGKGEVVRYDVNAGVYEVSLDWELDGGRHAIVFAQPEVLRREVRAQRGEIVLTPYGTGVMKGIRPTDGCHIVSIMQVSGEMTAYLAADSILRTLPAVVGATVMTNLGPAYIFAFRPEDGVYKVKLPYGIGYIQPDQITGPYKPTPQDDGCVVM